MPIVRERGAYLTAFHTEPGYTAGITLSTDLHIIPASVSVHVGLARFAGTIDGPGGATIGIAEYRYTDAEGQGQIRTFADEADWETAVYEDRVYFITIAVHVHRGQMKGWWYMQVWE